MFDEQETLELWKNEYIKSLFDEIPYGLGIMRWEMDGIGTVFGHDGQTFSAVALMAYDAGTGNVYTAAINNSQYKSVENGNPGSVWELVPLINQIVQDNPAP